MSKILAVIAAATLILGVVMVVTPVFHLLNWVFTGTIIGQSFTNRLFIMFVLGLPITLLGVTLSGLLEEVPGE